MSDAPEALGRRLFASVRRERPSAELRDRVLALGRAERAQMRSALVQRASLPERRLAYWLTRRSVGWGLGLAACGALAFAIASPFDDAPSIVMSAERSAVSDSRATTTPEQTPVHAPEQAAVVPPSSSSSQPSFAALSGSKRAREAQPPVPLRAEPTRADAGPAPEARSTFAEQLEQIKSARTALRAGAPARALSLLDVYAARARGGELAAEASLLRIEALAASGRRSEAARLARKFAVDHPNSPLIDRALAFTNE